MNEIKVSINRNGLLSKKITFKIFNNISINTFWKGSIGRISYIRDQYKSERKIETGNGYKWSALARRAFSTGFYWPLLISPAGSAFRSIEYMDLLKKIIIIIIIGLRPKYHIIIIVTVCVFVRHLFLFYPFYFDFHSARIIFDMSSGFYLWNINKTTAWHL